MYITVWYFGNKVFCKKALLKSIPKQTTSNQRRIWDCCNIQEEHFVIIVNGFQPLIIITKSSILDTAVVLDPSLVTVRGSSRDVEKITKTRAEICNFTEKNPFVGGSQQLN